MSELRRMDTNLRAVVRAGIIGAGDGIEEAGQDLLDTIRQLISRRRRSQPGEPPGYDTGSLYRSYKMEVDRTRFGRVTVTVASDAAERTPDGRPVDYATDLEFGTRYMEARPHVRVAVNIVRERATRTVARRMARAQIMAARAAR